MAIERLTPAAQPADLQSRLRRGIDRRLEAIVREALARECAVTLALAGAFQRCESMRRAVEACDWSGVHPQLRVTLSMGLASSRSFDCAASLVDAADHWLHEAKHRGRNQIQPDLGMRRPAS